MHQGCRRTRSRLVRRLKLSLLTMLVVPTQPQREDEEDEEEGDEVALLAAIADLPHQFQVSLPTTDVDGSMHSPGVRDELKPEWGEVAADRSDGYCRRQIAPGTRNCDAFFYLGERYRRVENIPQQWL
ncbi:hypothetical protein BDQ12DRAFT_408259 [Crucibulum laeve]|uniref:Secreted protein n=1 Tax=Crucibulum laeve TaxID=68775 RepID=A0A5C3LXQ6_9AGAR|nr:hypothetical protein BDQ12DRAFT_408259 [Crucibulum laeve]